MSQGFRTAFDVLKREIISNAGRNAGERRSLPPAAYDSDPLLKHELTQLFSREWICVGRTAQIPSPGDYLTFDLQHDPLLIIRQKDESIRAFANICLHRCARLLDHSHGHCSRIVCPYHSWTYRIDGKLMGAPFMEHNPQFGERLGSDEMRLKSFRCETWQGFIYVTRNSNIRSPAERLRGLDEVLNQFRLPDYVPVIEAEEDWDANWKCLLENFVDAYHIHRVHRDSFGPYGASEEYTTMLPGDAAFAWQCVDADPTLRTQAGQMIKRPMAPASNTWLSDEWRNRTVVAAVFPSHTMQLEADMLWHLSIQPLGVRKLRVKWWVAVPEEILAEQPDRAAYVQDLKRFLDLVNSEDKAIVENVHRNLLSQLAVPGPMSHLESNVFEFGQYLARSLERDIE